MARTIDVLFNTWDVVDALEGEGEDRDESRVSTPHHNKWAESTLEQVREWVRNGWPEGMVAIEVDGRDPVLGAGDVPAFEYGLSEEGSEVDVATYLQGEVDCMGDFRVVPLPKPLVRIGVDMSVHAGITTAQMLRVGRSVLVCVERLRAAGFPTQVDVLFSTYSTKSYNHNDQATIRVRVQEAGQPVQAALLAFWVAHPSALRRAMFALAETFDAETRDFFGFYYQRGYGKPMPGARKEEYDEWAPSAQHGEAVVGEWVRDVLTRHGLEGEEAGR